ncbi:MAG: DNA polymerase III subunit alpha [Burkholderiaceae bacterium]|nr:DNA polymerase III subunit alpha [Burkholderiaceae bacterium]
MFIHLRLHTEFSVVDGTARIDDAVASAAADGQPALAITDIANLFGAVKFYKAARGKGVKPILGAEVALRGLAADPATVSRVLLLAQNEQGYLNLCELLARAWTQGVTKAQAVAEWDWLAELASGLILLSGAAAGPVGQYLLAGDDARAAEVALQLASAFPHRFYLELQRAGRPDDERHVAAAVQLAARMKLPVVATHPVQFVQPEDFEAHEARVCIAEGEILGNPRRPRRFTPDQYFKSSAEMQALFADLPSALANSVEIGRRCNLSLTLGQPRLPDFPVPEGHTIETYFREASLQGLEERLEHLYPDVSVRDEQRPRYLERLEFEIDTILKMGFPGYFLIVGDFINWAKNNGCPVGPGRGSGAGSLVAYALKITDLDPLQYKLLFERFLNPERVSMPDFDIDFCQANRDRVIDYVKAKYGRDAVSQIATFGTMAARAAIRDVGRVLDMSYTFCDGISKLIPNKPGKPVTLQYPPPGLSADEKEKYAIAAEPILAQRIKSEEEVRTLVELAQKLEGMTRNIGMHAGGVLIAPGKLTDFGPLYQQPGSDAAVSQYDKDDVEAVGLVKFDFLGLATLTILELARQFIVARHPGQQDFAYENIALDDKATYELFQQGRTEAVFQFESRGMQGMLRDARPTRLEDLIALNALYRPGPMDLIPSFVARKHGREPVEYPHPLVADMLSETYGIMVYQEQVMQTAQILGGYSLGGADLLRRAMGKKKAEEMAQHRAIFRAGAAKNGIGEAKADEIFDLMEKFAGYGFNKSHAAAYSLLAYHTGWLKVHYTAEFYCANMTVEMDNTDKLKVLHEDALREGMAFEPPDVNRGTYRFEPVDAMRIRYGLGAIKGTGQQAIEAIVAAREGRGTGPAGEESGPFKSLFDFCRRVDRTRVNKRTVEALVRAGAFDSLQLNRAALAAAIDLGFEFAAAHEANLNQGGLFDLLDDSSGSSTQEPELPAVMPWGVKERLSFEKTAIGFYLSGHLFDECEREVRQFARRPLAELVDSREPQLLAGIVGDLRIINGQRGKLALFKLDDKSAGLDARADEALIDAHRHLLKDDELIIVQAKVMPDRFSGGLQLNITQIWDLPAARCRFGKFLRVAVGSQPPEVARLLADFPPRRESTEAGDVWQGLPVRLLLERRKDGVGVMAQLQLGEQAKFYPSDAALAGWMAQADEGRAQVVYD